ncbi:BEN domain-containing protein 2 [Monodon monoceros]|uniref:BEN domain-containing protein 2 n=1 Tax=Monodon monoceros TaxID=40151 RepID=UPI0010F7A7CC|nr:BEN domain-containing protein 2 [Monodon monoceros]
MVEHAYITIALEEDSDASDDADLVMVEDSDTEVTENIVSSDEVLTIQPDFEGDNDTSEEPSQLSYGVEGLAELGDQPVSQMNRLANLRRRDPYSAETEFIPLRKKARLSIPGEDNMDCMGDCSPSLPVERQEDNAETNPVGTSLQSAALPELQQPVLRESPPPPRIVSTYSLEPCFTPRSPSPGLPVLSSYVSEGAESTNSVISSAQATVAVPIAVLPQGEPSLADTSETVNYSTIMGNNSMGPDAALTFLCMPPITEVSGKAETSLGNSTESRYYPTFLGNDSGRDTASSSIFIPPNFVEKYILVEVPGTAETSLENSSQTVYYPTLLGNISGPDTDSSSHYLLPSFALEKALLTEMPGKAETSMKNSSQTVYYPNLVGNDSGPDAASSTLSIPPNFGYLGDPRRNVRMLDIHLMTAQKEATPKHAARYLVRILFSKEIMISSSVAVNSQGRQPLDPNKMAAIREHLAAIFPNHDLRECGKDWQACISDINSLICHLCSKRTPFVTQLLSPPRSSESWQLEEESTYTSFITSNSIRGLQPTQKTVNNIEPTNPDTDSNDKRDGDDGESSSLLSQQAAGSETRENGNSQQNSSALPEGIKEPSTDNSTVSYETLEYLGNPCRNIQMPKSVLNIAKEKSLPELSARYLICNLFTEEVLIKSNVYGSLGRGTCALNANKINALREFLQDIYPTCDLSETGYDWKFCVTAINSCICSLRYDHKKSTSKSQPPPETTPSTETGLRNARLSKQGGPATTLSLGSELITPTWAVAREPSTRFRLFSGGCQPRPPTSQLPRCWLRSFQVSALLVRRRRETLSSAPCLGGQVRL